MNDLLKRVLKDGVRPLLIPLYRGYIRYFPVHRGKRFVWKYAVGPYLQYGDHPFVVRTLHGRRIAGNTIDLIQRYIYYFGIWEPALTSWIQKRLKPGDIFVDVGANIGYFTTLASSLVGEQGKVIAFEASPKIFKYLEANLRNNRILNTQALNIAVSDRKGKVKVYSAGEGNIGETSIIQQEGREFETEVESETLSSILSGYENERIRIVKIDVEGAESLVVDGMRELLNENSRMDVIMEINPETLRTHHMTYTDITKVFEKAGYCAYSLENDYSALSYLMPRRNYRPIRISEPILDRTDVLFTKEDIEEIMPSGTDGPK